MGTGDKCVASDGKYAIEVGQWAVEKLEYIRKYCYIFNAGMKDKWELRNYIDLFAGGGKCLISNTTEEIDGSPIVALNCPVPFTSYFFNDLEASDLMLALRSRIENRTSPTVAGLHYFTLDCNEAVDAILKQLPAARYSLDFAFIDPLNWEIRFDSIKRLSLNRHMDLAITFHLGSIKRVADSPPAELDKFFPDSGWRDDYARARGRGKRAGRVLLDAYERGLSDIGYVAIKDYILVVNSQNTPLYHLIFASKSRRGAEFWDKIAVKSSTGQFRMKGLE